MRRQAVTKAWGQAVPVPGAALSLFLLPFGLLVALLGVPWAALVRAADGAPPFREGHWGAQQRVRIPEVLRAPRAALSAAGNIGHGTGPGALCG